MKRRSPWHRVGRCRVAELRVLEWWRLPTVRYGSSREYSNEEELNLCKVWLAGGKPYMNC